jgi:glycine cleavage system aminomethyltransferase T
LQGPAAESVLATLDASAATMTFMQARTLTLAGAACFATRSGYTGEDGYEISLPLEAAERIARLLLDDPRVAPVGLGARDTLRLEAGLPLHGSDITPTVSPVEAGLAFAIPKSRIFTDPFHPIITFSGVTSRWTMLSGWFVALLLVLRVVWPRALRAGETVGG